MKVSQLMTKDVAFCLPDQTLCDAAGLMWQRDCGCVPIVEDWVSMKVVGMITDRDICMAACLNAKAPHEMKIRDHMSSAQVQTCLDTARIEDAERIMRERQIRRLPVVNAEGSLVGVISINDLALEAMRERKRTKPEVRESEVMGVFGSICAHRS